MKTFSKLLEMVSLLFLTFVSGQAQAAFLDADISDNVKTFISGEIELNVNIYYPNLCLNDFESQVEILESKINIRITEPEEFLGKGLNCADTVNVVPEKVFLGHLSQGFYEIVINDYDESELLEVR